MDEHAYLAHVARMYAYALSRSVLSRKTSIDGTAAAIARDEFQEQLPLVQGACRSYQAGFHYISTDDRQHPGSLMNRPQYLIARGVGGSNWPTVTPLSAWSAGCDGSPISLSTRLSATQCRVIQYFRIGRGTLSFWPFMLPRRKHQTHHGPRAALFTDAANAVCPFGCGASQHTPVHFATTCAAAHWTGYQAHLRSETRRLLFRMCTLLTKAQGMTSNPQLAAAVESVRATLSATTAADWLTDDYIHVVIRLLSCTPFSAFDIRAGVAPQAVAAAAGPAQHPPHRRPHGNPTAMPLSRAVGTMLDSVRIQRSYLRNWANVWTQWSYRRIMEMAGHYNCGRGMHRQEVPCHTHRHNEEYRQLAGSLHDNEHLGRDAAAVGSDPDSDSDTSTDSTDSTDSDTEDRTVSTSSDSE